KFPAKYQEAFFGCDWSYGKLFAAHIKAQGASYTGELEEFLNGSPLPLTDVVINPKDGAMYFTIGGRGTMSGVYRVTYVGKESTEPLPTIERAPNPQRDARHKLEALYGTKDPHAVATAWPYLSNEDRHLRWAARTVLEFQDPASWREKALAERNPVALTNAVIGLTRVGDKDQAGMLEALERIEFGKLTTPQQLDYLRAYGLLFSRTSAPNDSWRERVGKRLDAFYPAPVREVNQELSRLIAYLEVPGGVGKTLALLAKAPTQEE